MYIKHIKSPIVLILCLALVFVFSMPEEIFAADTTAPVINSISFKDADSIDGTSYMYADIDVTEDGTGVQLIQMSFMNEDGHTAYVEWAGEGMNAGTEPLLYTGSHTIKIATSNKMALGEYTLQGIYIVDRNGNGRSYNRESFASIFGDNSYVINVVKTNCKDIKAPIINRITIVNEIITTPDVLKIDIDVTEDGSGVQLIQMSFINEDGHTANIEWAGEGMNAGTEPLFYTGNHTIKIPVNPFKGDGKYTLQDISIFDKNGNVRSYYGSNLNDITRTKGLEINSTFNIAYYGSLRNINGAYEAILSMNNGDTVVLDCRDAKVAPRKLFTAVAGKDRILAFEDEDVQWVFDGKRIQSGKCKNINLSTYIDVQSGFAAGFPNDSKVVSIRFANNGLLPGKADVRINNEYITQKYAGGSGNVKLSYINDGVAKLEDNNVKIADDNAAELKMTHNSTFVLSKSNAPQIKGVTIKKPKKAKKAITVKWKKQTGKSFNKHIDGYQIQYSKSNNFATGNKIKSIKGYKKASCKIKKLVKKKKYYVRVRSYLKYKGHTYYSNWSKTMSVKTR